MANLTKTECTFLTFWYFLCVISCHSFIFKFSATILEKVTEIDKNRYRETWKTCIFDIFALGWSRIVFDFSKICEKCKNGFLLLSRLVVFGDFAFFTVLTKKWPFLSSRKSTWFWLIWKTVKYRFGLKLGQSRLIQKTYKNDQKRAKWSKSAGTCKNVSKSGLVGQIFCTHKKLLLFWQISRKTSKREPKTPLFCHFDTFLHAKSEIEQFSQKLHEPGWQYFFGISIEFILFSKHVFLSLSGFDLFLILEKRSIFVFLLHFVFCKNIHTSILVNLPSFRSRCKKCKNSEIAVFIFQNVIFVQIDFNFVPSSVFAQSKSDKKCVFLHVSVFRVFCAKCQKVTKSGKSRVLTKVAEKGRASFAIGFSEKGPFCKMHKK